MADLTRDGYAPTVNEVEMALAEKNWDAIGHMMEKCPRSGNAQLLAFDAELLNGLDNTFKRYFIENPGKKNMTVTSRFMADTTEARETWDEYRLSVMETFCNHILTGKSRIPAQTIGRVALRLVWRPNYIQPTPILTASVLEAINIVLSVIPRALTEVRVFLSRSHRSYPFDS
jgi:hypothetical protein